MYFQDGPLNYNFGGNKGSSGMPPCSIDFSGSRGSSGMPSVNVGSYTLNVGNILSSMKSLHGQMNSIWSMVLDANIMNAGAREEPVIKSAVEACKLRNAGNEEFKKNHLHEALKLYTKSIANAFEGSEEQMLAYGNRSAVLLKLGELESCLYDINRSLESDAYPQSSRENLEKRKESCLAAIKTKGIQKVNNNATNPVEAPENDDNVEWQALCQFDNPLIQNASAKIKITCDDVWGRHLVATEDIEPGEILSCQKFNSLLLHEDAQEELSYCSFCLSKCLALIPCPTCIESMYCSTYCRTQAYESYHRTECKLLYKANKSTYKLRAMRMLIEGTEQGARVPDLMARMTTREIMAEKTDPSNQPFANDYMAVLRMSRTFNPTFLGNFYTFVTDFITGLRDIGLCSGGITRSHTRGFSKAEEFVAMLLMNHATTSRSHSFAISSIEKYDCTCDHVLGIGICPLHSLINNSCDPNVNFFIRNRQHVLVATRPIKKGEQLFHSYWRTFQCASKEKRNEKFSMFFGFTCKCQACMNDWPATNILKKRGVQFRVENLTNAKTELLEILNPLTGDCIMELKNEDIIRCMSRLCSWAYTYVRTPSYLLTECQDQLLQSIVLTYDTLSKKFTAEELRKNVKSLVNYIEQKVVRIM